MQPLETPRLTLRHLNLEDDEFIVTLLNSPGWLRFIGDRNVRDRDAARGYIERTSAAYTRHGHGLYLVALRDEMSDGTSIGLCGPIRRDGLEDADLGFALLPEHAGHGYAVEAARRVLEHARDDLHLTRIAGITTPDNERSIRTLETLGFRFAGTVRLPNDDTELNHYLLTLTPTSR
ncbi:MAG: GNAT family N-acetyltransferase [Pleurocapsa sp. SU_196_0]|nr:GNAT family N-acetyltransferase [Pleurocapsa sp. SU_196_0]